MTAVLLYGDTVRNPAIRHEIPLETVDALLFVARGDRRLVAAHAIERDGIRRALPDAELLTFDELGALELIDAGASRDEALLEAVVRALGRWGVTGAVVAGDLPVAVADRLRAAGIGLEVDDRTVSLRRRVKSAAELAGIRRAQRAAEAGMAVARRLIKGAEVRGNRLLHGGEALTAERVRAEARAACARLGAPAPPNLMVVSAWSGGGHDPGSGPLPAGLPIQVDLWPRDEASGCWADMTRTFVGGEVPDAVAALAAVARGALEQVRAAARPGIAGQALYDVAAGVVERAGHPTLRTREPGRTPTHGFRFDLGHGVGLEVHEPPVIGPGGRDALVAGDVIAVEPGIDGIAGLGGVRYEDLLLVTEDGCETLTDFAYEL